MRRGSTPYWPIKRRTAFAASVYTFWSGPAIRNAWPTTARVFAASLPVQPDHCSRSTRYGGKYTAMPLMPAAVREVAVTDCAHLSNEVREYAGKPRPRDVNDAGKKRKSRRGNVGLEYWRPSPDSNGGPSD